MKFYAKSNKQVLFSIDNSETVDKSNGIIKWGKKNDTPFEYIKLLHTSPVHRGIIESKVSYIISDGWEVVNGTVDAFLKNGFSDFDLTDVAEQCVYDLETFGAMAIKVGLNNLQQYAYCEHLDVDLLRQGENENEWVYCEDWSDSRAEKKIYEVYNATKEQGAYILYFKLPTKREKKELGVYPKPSYIAALTDIVAAAEICKFRESSIKNNFSLGTIINNPNGIPETDEEKKAARQYADTFINAGELTGGYVISYSDGKDKEISVHQINGNDLDKRYLQTEVSIVNNILTAHSVTSGMLVGIKTSGQLGGSEEIETSFEIFKQTYISKRQNFVNRAFNYILNNIAEIEGEIKLVEAKLPISQKNNEVLKKEQQYSRKSRVIELFGRCGKKKDDCNIVLTDSVPVDFTTADAETFASEKVKNFFDEIGVVTATDRRFTVLNLIQKGNRIVDIATITDQSIDDVYKDIANLKKAGYLSENLKVTTKGTNALKVVDVPIDEFEVRFTYEKRDDIAGSTLIDTSRDFCRELVGLNRAYTRQEIDIISQIEGRDVFKERGGWYHNPQTDRNTPFCRHIWKFILVQK